MSHEVRTPMNAILGFSDILMKSSFDPQESRQYLEVIHNSSQQLLNLINDIIDISLIESGHFKISRNTFPLSRVFHQVMVLHKMSADQKGIDLRLEWGSQGRDEVEVFSDEGRVIQVLNNLVGNAIKFTHEGSVVIGFELNQRNVRFFVRDTGIGIPYDYHDIIFERFRQVDERYSRKYGGTGLGLSICKSIVEKMGGEISVQSEPGKGSCFTFEIPGILAHSV
jgi:signal transduction histidine kinase